MAAEVEREGGEEWGIGSDVRRDEMESEDEDAGTELRCCDLDEDDFNDGDDAECADGESLCLREGERYVE